MLPARPIADNPHLLMHEVLLEQDGELGLMSVLVAASDEATEAKREAAARKD